MNTRRVREVYGHPIYDPSGSTSIGPGADGRGRRCFAGYVCSRRSGGDHPEGRHHHGRTPRDHGNGERTRHDRQDRRHDVERSRRRAAHLSIRRQLPNAGLPPDPRNIGRQAWCPHERLRTDEPYSAWHMGIEPHLRGQRPRLDWRFDMACIAAEYEPAPRARSGLAAVRRARCSWTCRSAGGDRPGWPEGRRGCRRRGWTRRSRRTEGRCGRGWTCRSSRVSG